MKTFTHEIKDELGIHARPAGMIVNLSKDFTSTITLSANGKSAVANKLISIMMMSVKCGQTVEVTVEGEDEEAAFVAVKEFFEENL